MNEHSITAIISFTNVRVLLVIGVSTLNVQHKII